MPTRAHTLVQLVALGCLIAGCYLVAGLGVALLVGGMCALVSSALAEFAGPVQCSRPHVDATATSAGGA